MIILLMAIVVMLMGIICSMPFKTDKETKELLKKICENTRDKTIPVKPVNVEVEKSPIGKWGNCPICSALIHNAYDHCKNCGAELDWSDTERGEDNEEDTLVI